MLLELVKQTDLDQRSRFQVSGAILLPFIFPLLGHGYHTSSCKGTNCCFTPLQAQQDFWGAKALSQGLSSKVRPQQVISSLKPFHKWPVVTFQPTILRPEEKAVLQKQKPIFLRSHTKGSSKTCQVPSTQSQAKLCSSSLGSSENTRAWIGKVASTKCFVISASQKHLSNSADSLHYFPFQSHTLWPSCKGEIASQSARKRKRCRTNGI